MERLKTFKMIRPQDETGVSGTGHVLDGVEFPNGRVVVSWCGKGANSLGIFDSFSDFLEIHVKSHPTNKTVIVWEHEEGDKRPTR